MRSTVRAVLAAHDYESVTRNTRWILLLATIITFPPENERAVFVYGLAGFVAIYNLLRYSRRILAIPFFSNKAITLVTDNIFVIALLWVVGSFNTPYTLYLGFIVIAAAYQYQLKGTIAVGFIQAFGFGFVSLHPDVPVVLSRSRSILLEVIAFLAIGYMVERLTHSDRVQKEELHQLNAEKEAERSRLEVLVNSVSDAVFIVDATGRILQANGAAKTLTDQVDISGKLFAEVMPLKPIGGAEDKKIDLFKHGDAQHRRDLAIIAGNNDKIDLDITIQPVSLQGRRSVDYVVVCRDITKEHTLDEQRSEFISVASHELRTPVAIIEAALATLLINKKELPPMTAELIEQTHQNAAYLSAIIKDLSTLAQAHNDALPIQLEKINPTKLLRQIEDDFTPQTKQKDLKISLDIEPHLPVILSTVRHIREILQNYMTNAIKYSDKGTIILGVKASQVGGLIFWVKDEGVGISVSDQRHLFKKFFRAEDFRTRETGGTGLGLYLCRELAERLAGRVWCESEYNHGSTFYLEIPPYSPLKKDQGEFVKAQVANLIDGL